MMSVLRFGNSMRRMATMATSFPRVKCWPVNGTNPLGQAHISVPQAAADELLHWTQAASGTHIDNITVKRDELPACVSFVQQLEETQLVAGPGFAVTAPIPGLSHDIPRMRLAALALTSCLGDPLVQNAMGERSILVFDRDVSKTMADGQRYHQSREGGSLHTDNVNVPNTWEYMLLTCLKPAMQGGENILVSGFSLYNYLEENDPTAIETLSEDFLFEFRGFDSRFYRAPILFFNKLGQPCFRWLRDYIESAHRRASVPLTPKQLAAMDALTAASLKPELQVHYRFRQGEILFANDMQLLHGRTAFVDAAPSSPEYDMANPQNRLLQRNWLQTATPVYRGINQSRYEILG